jgi:hypothetical protein
MTFRSVASASVVALLLLVGVRGQQPPPRGPFAADEILVKFSRGATALQRNSIVSERGATRLRRFPRFDIERLRLPRGLSVQAAIAAFRAMPGVEYAQPNYSRWAIQQAPPNDPFWLDGSLWGLEKIQAQQAWTSFTAGDGSVVIANIDTGVDYTHPDLAANMWRNPTEIPGNGVDDDLNGYVDDVFGIDTANFDSDPMDDQGHGTHTAGTAAAVGNNELGVTGVTWNAKILSCKFLDWTGYGTDAGAIECFDYIVGLRQRGVNIRVSSNSWGGTRGAEPPSPALMAAIEAAGQAGILNVFGAGNDGANNDEIPFDPASYEIASIISVASSGPTDRRSFFSNYGATSVDIAAPGQDILSTYPGDSYELLSGTSMATPVVAGAAALLASMDPALTPGDMKALLMDNVDQLSRWNGVVVSGGRLNVFKAAEAIGTLTPNEPPTVAMTQPVEGQSFREPVSIVLSADAADSDGTIASVGFYANGAIIGFDHTSPYSLTWAMVPPGSYTLTAVATDNRGAAATSAPVAISVAANPPPDVTITSPAGGTIFPSASTITVNAAADDSDGVQQVVFQVNGVTKATDTTSPYSFSFTGPVGDYTLTAIATDQLGATATSAPVQVSVAPLADRVNLALPAKGGSATASSTYSPNYPVSATINGDRKGLNWGAGGGWNDATTNTYPDWVEIAFNGSKLIEEVNVFSMQDNYPAPVEPTPTQTFTLWGLRAFEVQYWDGDAWVPVPDGTIANNTLVWRRIVFLPLITTKIRVHITAALNGNSRMMEVEAWGIPSGVNTPPSVSLSSPAAGAVFSAPANISITADATDSDGTIQEVTFYANGSPIGSRTSSPYTFTWTNVAAGSYSLTAVATDNEGATTTSDPVSISVASNAAPSVSISSPAGGATFTAPANVTVTAAASDSDGTIASVAFHANGTLIGTAATSPYSVTWTSVAAGSYSLTATATDNLGATTTSAPVAITVGAPVDRVNVARASNGGVATASSTYTANYPASGTINGDRKGLQWGAGGGWNDGTSNAYPDWLDVTFSGTKTIDEVSVFSMQDNYGSPVEPTPTMTFGNWGLRNFEIQYWTGSSWMAIPGASIVNNNLVWRKFTFAPVTTTKIRVHITSALNGFSRMVEVEAWGVAGSGGGNTPPTVTLTSPAAGSMFTSPATITVDATAADSDGSVTSVAFYANGTALGTDSASPYSVSWPNVPAGTYSLTAVATDNLGATTTSTAVSIVVNPPAGRMNMALSANGAVAAASSIYGANYGTAGAINGDRKGLGWGAGGGWNDGTANTYPDWIEVTFSGSKTIDEVSVFSMQDNYTAPVEPTATMTFGSWGLRNFEVQYWTGTAWAPIPGASITNNNLVWRKFTFTPVTTTKIRVHITGALNGFSRMVELEAWGVSGGS